MIFMSQYKIKNFVKLFTSVIFVLTLLENEYVSNMCGLIYKTEQNV